MEETDFDFGEAEKGSSPSSPDLSTLGGASRRLGPLESRLSSPGQNEEEVKNDSFLEDYDGDSKQEVLEQSMRSNQQEEDEYEDEYEDEFEEIESDKSGEASPKPVTKGGWSSEKDKSSPPKVKNSLPC